MTIINITTTMTLAPIDPPTIVPIEVELRVLVLVLVGLVLVYTSVHSGPVIPFGGNTKFLPTLIYSCIK